MDDKDKVKKRAMNIRKIRLEREKAVFMKLGGKLRGAVVAVFQCVVAWCVAAGLYQLLLLIV